MSLLSRKEKEKLVLELAYDGKTTREIAKAVHISLKDIGKIILKVTGDDVCPVEKEKDQKHFKSLYIYAQAFQMFKDMKSLADVVIELRYRDLPKAPVWRKMVGPSIILAGLAPGSGEFIFWPYITYKTGFVFFWACMLGVFTQFFINMEIERWTLATGESPITGFCRLSRQWAWIMLALNVVPWIWPGWATGAATLSSWMMFGATETPVAARCPWPRPPRSTFDPI